MTTATQQIQSDPARRFADKILARTNNGRDVIDLLHNISQGGYNANKNDRVTAAKYLVERGYGKCPTQSPATNPDSEHSPESDDNDVGTLPESPSAVPHTGPESPRLVTQANDALNESFGPAPSAHPPTGHFLGEPDPYSTQDQDPYISDSPETPDPFSIQASIQDYIIEITNDGDTLIDTLIEIAYADDDDPTVTSYHRTRAGRILGDRFMGANPNALRSAACPECRRKWSAHPGSPAHPERGTVENPVLLDDDEIEAAKPETWEKVFAKLKQLEDEGARTPGLPAAEIDYSAYMPSDDFDLTPYLDEADAFKAKVALRVERQKNWPEIEERRRKKLAQIYPSHSEDEDGQQPDT